MKKKSLNENLCRNGGHSLTKIHHIEINFPVPIEMPPGFEQALVGLVEIITKQYEKENPDRIMWPAGSGNKILWREPQEPDMDPDVYCIDVAEREKSEKEKRRGR
jgi:hypothetical protein